MRVGVAFGRDEFAHPGFRRRFGYYCRRRGLAWRPAVPSEEYDVVFVHHSADLPRWLEYHKSPIIFDINDDYLTGAGKSLKAKFRGFARFLAGHYSRPVARLSRLYSSMASRSRVVVCSSEAVRLGLLQVAKDVVEILDFHLEQPCAPKKAYVLGEGVNIIWEGFPDFRGFGVLGQGLEELSRRRETALHLMTSPFHTRFLGSVGRFRARDELPKYLNYPEVFFYDWNSFLIGPVAVACDFAVIPICEGDAFAMSRPANRLLFFWKLGIPVLASKTAEYDRMMKRSGLDMCCSGPDEWRRMLLWLAADEAARRLAGEAGRAFAEREYGEERTLALWDQAIDRAIG
jgi:glycosyltransferase involved in cell wall biosynthesis